MRKLILAATGFVCLTGASYFIGTAAGQGKKAAADDAPHKIGLIDIGYIFENYEKVKVLRQETMEEMQEIETDFKKRVTKFNSLREEMKEFKEGSQEYTTREAQLTAQAAQLEAHKKTMTRKMQRTQAQMYQTVYLEIHDTLKKVCNRDGYTVVLRFSRDEMASADPQKVMEGIARPVVYHRPGDDVTLLVLDYLDRQYKNQSSAGAAEKPAPTTSAKPPVKSAVKPASGTKAGTVER